MSKIIKSFAMILTVIIIYSFPQSLPAGTDITVNAAEYICAKAREGKKNRLAIYSFTNESGETSTVTKGYSTKIMSLILDKKEFKVIDPERIPEIVNEQEKGLTGLVDPETAAETGKIIGADALVFGISGPGSLQVRIVDAATGEVIGATLEEKSGKTEIKNEDYKSPDGKKKFIAAEFQRNLQQLYEKHPMIYLYITANDDELRELDETFPIAMRSLKQKISAGDPEKNKKFEKRKKRLADFRNTSPGFDRRIRESRRNLFERLKDKKKRK